MKYLTLALFFLMVILPMAAPAQTGAAAQMESLETAFKEQLAKVDQPLAELESNYVKALDRLGKKRQEASDFDGMMVVKKEKERIEAGAEPAKDDAADEEIVVLRSTLEREQVRIRKTLQKSKLKAHEDYKAELLKLVTLLTMQGDIDGALLAHNALVKIGKIIDTGFDDPDSAPPSNLKVLWSLTDGGRYETHPDLTVDKTLDGVVLRMDGTRGERLLTARKTFTPPYRIRALASTDSTNIRFKFGPKGRVIFNWEVKRAELRIHGYDTGSIKPVGGAGLLELNRFYDIEIDVTERGILVRVDGEERGEINASSSLAEGKFSVGPAFGSVITFKELELVELDEEQASEGAN